MTEKYVREAIQAVNVIGKNIFNEWGPINGRSLKKAILREVIKGGPLTDQEIANGWRTMPDMKEQDARNYAYWKRRKRVIPTRGAPEFSGDGSNRGVQSSEKPNDAPGSNKYWSGPFEG